MKQAIDQVKSEVKAKLLFWNNIQSRKVKAALVLLCVGLIGLKILEPNEFKKIEPNISGVKALWVPQSGIIDYKSVTNKLAENILSINSKSLILTGCEVLDFFNNKIIK